MTSPALNMSDLRTPGYRQANRDLTIPQQQQQQQEIDPSTAKGTTLAEQPSPNMTTLSTQLSTMQRENEDLLEKSQKLLLNLVGDMHDSSFPHQDSAFPAHHDSTFPHNPTARTPGSSTTTTDGSAHNRDGNDHRELQHSIAEHASQQLLLQHRIKTGEEQVKFLRQQLLKKQNTVAKQQEELHRQLLKSRGTLDDMSRTMKGQEQDIDVLRAQLENANELLVQKTGAITSLQRELADNDAQHQLQIERCSAELNDLRHSRVVERETVSRKIDEVVQQVREKEDELETVVASMTTHDVTMQAKDRLITGLEEKVETYRRELENQTTEVVAQRQKFSELQRDAENGQRKVLQLTASLQHCQKQLELHVEETRIAETVRSQQHREVGELKAKLNQLDRNVEEKVSDCRHLRSSKVELEAMLAQQKHAASFAEQRQQDAENNVAKLKAEVSQLTAELQLRQGELSREKEHTATALAKSQRLESEKQQVALQMNQRLDVAEQGQRTALQEKAQLEAKHEKQKEQLAQAKMQQEKQWQSEVQLTEKLTTSNADLLKCRKELQDKQEELTHVELHLAEAKSQLHSRDVQCSELRDGMERQKQNMMQRASQVNQLVLSVQSSQSKQQDEVDSLHSEIQQLQTQLQSSLRQHEQCSQELQMTKTKLDTLQKQRRKDREALRLKTETVSSLQESSMDFKQRTIRMTSECDVMRTKLAQLNADLQKKAAELEESEKLRKQADKRANEMESKLRDIHRRLTGTATVNQSLVEELSRANDLVKTGDEVSLSRVQILEERLSTLRESYQGQINDLQAKHSELLQALGERDASHRVELSSQMEVIDAIRRQETEAQLTAAQCSAELVRVRKQLHWFQQEIVQKDSTMKEVDLKLSSLERSVAQSTGKVHRS